MSEMTGRKRMQLPEELLEQVTGGYSLDQLTAEENARIESLGKAYADAYCNNDEKEMQRINELIWAFHYVLIAKYGE